MSMVAIAQFVGNAVRNGTMLLSSGLCLSLAPSVTVFVLLWRLLAVALLALTLSGLESCHLGLVLGIEGGLGFVQVDCGYLQSRY